MVTKPDFRKVLIMDIKKECFSGTPVVITNYITKTVRRKTHRKKRIDKKWQKKYGYKDVPDDSKILMFDGLLFMTQKCYDKLIKGIKNEILCFNFGNMDKST